MRGPQILPPQTDALTAALADRIMRSGVRRARLAFGLEATLWTVTMGWLFYLGAQIWIAFKHRQEFDGRSVFELTLLALLVFWPIFRVRILHGYWMRDWDDAPTASDRQRSQRLPRYPEGG
jgi:hypothetical protein